MSDLSRRARRKYTPEQKADAVRKVSIEDAWRFDSRALGRSPVAHGTGLAQDVTCRTETERVGGGFRCTVAPPAGACLECIGLEAATANCRVPRRARLGRRRGARFPRDAGPTDTDDATPDPPLTFAPPDVERVARGRSGLHLRLRRAERPDGLEEHIARIPIAAFGRSAGDPRMIEYTQGGRCASFELLALHGEAQRESAHPGRRTRRGSA